MEISFQDILKGIWPTVSFNPITMSELITVPSVVVWQDIEPAVQINYYNGSIELVQQDDRISIEHEFINALIKAIKLHYPEAKRCLEKR